MPFKIQRSQYLPTLILHDQNPFSDGNVPHYAGHGHIRAARLPLVRDKVFDGHLRTVFQPGGKIGETAVQFFGLLRVQFAPFGGQPGSFPYCRLVARQRGKRRGHETASTDGSPRNMMRKVNDVVVGRFHFIVFSKRRKYSPPGMSQGPCCS